MTLRHQRLSDRLRELPATPGKPDAVLRPDRKVEPAPVMVGNRLVESKDARLQTVKFHGLVLCGQYGSIVEWTPTASEDAPA